MASTDPRLLRRISPTPISLDEAMRFVASPDAGGIASFVGTARTGSSISPDRAVIGLEYEAYVPMAEELLEAIAAEMFSVHAIDRIALMHRVGSVAIGEVAIVVAASARHRAPAFDACRAATEAIKARLPVWKKELYADGGAWIGSGA